ncbi:putative small lipoprotein YifL [Halomonas organivorans]|uniref:Putative small lipoprotein YifL n=1 Tax=Halomonas organivorans TaxID=257772 RepID=A0A7W5G5P9_9GAMM|nr:lipoprotein [Halomonas organivorans]MBB3141335.1 putative small lipoprotein YifL [Halomonas organivorans]
MRRLAPLTLLTLALLAGCGQKGPLYLPGDEAAAERYGPRDAQQGGNSQGNDDSQGNDANADDTRSADEDD